MVRAVRKSLSSWRAWIEIREVFPCVEHVIGRSPQGERGLK